MNLAAYWQVAGLLALYDLEDLLTKRFGNAGAQALLVALKRDIARRNLTGQAALIYVRATRILYESAKPLRYTGGRR